MWPAPWLHVAEVCFWPDLQGPELKQRENSLPNRVGAVWNRAALKDHLEFTRSTDLFHEVGFEG